MKLGPIDLGDLSEVDRDELVAEADLEILIGIFETEDLARLNQLGAVLTRWLALSPRQNLALTAIFELIRDERGWD
jgi:hypothetical protein